MTKMIIGTVSLGIVAGVFIIPDSLIEMSGNVVTVGLCVLLLLVGIDIGSQGSVFKMIKESGVKLIIVPIFVIIGSLVAGFVGGTLVLGFTWNESLAVASGLGWYTLSPMLVAEYSAALSAVCFISNLTRELFSIVLVPIVSKKIGYLECVSMGGATTMDVLLPVIEKATDGKTAIYAFVSGAVCSAAVPVLVNFFINI